MSPYSVTASTNTAHANTTQDAISAAVAAEIRTIATLALIESDGRASYTYTPIERPSATGIGYLLVSAEILMEQGLAGDPVFETKKNVLWLLSHPGLDLVGRAARKANVSGPVQDKVAVRLMELLERKVFQNPNGETAADDEVSGAGLDLVRVTHPTPKLNAAGQPVLDADGTPLMNPVADAVGWARQFLASAVGPTVKRILRYDPSLLTSFNEVESDASGSEAPNGVLRMIVDLGPSAEDQHIDAADEQNHADRGETSLEALERWKLASDKKRGVARIRIDADALRDGLALPELCTLSTGSELRALSALVDSDPTLARRSLENCADGIYDEALVPDTNMNGALLGLWDNYTAADSARLLDTETRVIKLLVRAALTMDEKPGAIICGAVRRLARTASSRPGWNALATRLVNAYVAEYFSGVNSANAFNRDEAARDAVEADRAAAAAGWPAAAAEALAWPGAPLATATTEADVAAWVGNLFAAAAE